MSRSKGEDIFASQLALSGIEFTREAKVDPKRRWRFDFAITGTRMAIEVEGGVWVAGRHTRGAGYEKDLEKYNRAALLGWVVLRYTTKQITSGHAITELTNAMKGYIEACEI